MIKIILIAVVALLGLVTIFSSSDEKDEVKEVSKNITKTKSVEKKKILKRKSKFYILINQIKKRV